MVILVLEVSHFLFLLLEWRWYVVSEEALFSVGSCGKLFKSQLEVEYHATKSGHSNFSESTEEKKPLTDEEKQEQLRKIEEKLKEKRKEREESEKKEALEKEKRRIQSGKEIAEAKKKYVSYFGVCL